MIGFAGDLGYSNAAHDRKVNRRDSTSAVGESWWEESRIVEYELVESLQGKLTKVEVRCVVGELACGRRMRRRRIDGQM